MQYEFAQSCLLVAPRIRSNQSCEKEGGLAMNQTADGTNGLEVNGP